MSNGSGTDDDTPSAFGEPGPHPLATALAHILAALPVTPRVVLLGVGSGRSIPILLKAGAFVDAAEDDAQRARDAQLRFAREARVRVTHRPYDELAGNGQRIAAALSTHALLHGTPATIAAAIDAVRKRLAPEAPFFVTLGSQRDPRFGTGRLIAPGAFVTLDGREAGVAHSYFDEAGIRKLFAGFTLDDVRETDASEIVGRWAHSERETAGIVHWWVRARRDQ